MVVVAGWGGWRRSRPQAEFWQGAGTRSVQGGTPSTWRLICGINIEIPIELFR